MKNTIENKRKILIDCDPGHDDAIMLLISSFEKSFDILGVSSCSGNQTIEKTTTNVNNLLSYFSRKDIEIAKGHSTPIIRPTRICSEIHGESGLDGFDFPKYQKRICSEEACDFIINKLKTNKNVTVITTGPMTNLGLALQKDPSIATNIEKIVLMGGSTKKGNITPYAEFNILVDPEAANICFKSGAPIRMLGLNVTRKILVTDYVIKKASNINTRGADLFVKLMKVFNENQISFFGLKAGPLHDPATVISLINTHSFKFKKMDVVVDTSFNQTEGQTICKPNKYSNIEVAISVNLKEYWKTVFKSLEAFK